MDTILVKIFATALALSEVMTEPQAVKTHFDPVADRNQVTEILRAGCTHMKQAFDVESINLDDLIATALDYPKAMGADVKAFHGLNFTDLNTAYHQFCKSQSEDVANPVVDLGEVIEFFNNAAAELPDPLQLKGRKLPGMSTVLDNKDQTYAELFQPGNRRIWGSLGDIPAHVQKAFIAAEDRRFFQHHGVDERGIIRAFIGNLGSPGRPQGGSTITQQVVKNLLVGSDVTYDRKIRELIVASRLEDTLSKEEILELYLNSVYLGRGSWGIERAARDYFGKSARNLTLTEGAMMAGLLKGASYFNPDRHPDRAKERLNYVLGRMEEDGVITTEQKEAALAAFPKLIAFHRPHRDSGFQFIDFLGREAKTDGVASLTAESYTVHSTIDAQLQHDTEAALQEGLARAVGMAIGIKIARTLEQACQHGTFGQREVPGRLAEIVARGPLDAPRVTAEIHRVQVKFENLCLTQRILESRRHYQFADLALVGHVATDQQILDDLLGYGQATLRPPAIAEIADEGAHDATLIDAMLKEAPILGGNECLLHVIGNIAERNPGAPVAELEHFGIGLILAIQHRAHTGELLA